MRKSVYLFFEALPIELNSALGNFRCPLTPRFKGCYVCVLGMWKLLNSPQPPTSQDLNGRISLQTLYQARVSILASHPRFTSHGVRKSRECHYPRWLLAHADRALFVQQFRRDPFDFSVRPAHPGGQTNQFCPTFPQAALFLGFCKRAQSSLWKNILDSTLYPSRS